MDKYLIKRKTISDSSSMPDKNNVDNSKQSRIEINLADLPADPGLRIRILDYNPNIRDEVRRAYLLKGPCQPRSHDFPYTAFGKSSRRFNPAWFDEFSTWLEYSVNKDAAYCLCCYLFKQSIGDQAGGDSFVGLGFKNWARKDKLTIHIGGVNSAHNQAWGKCEALLNKKQHIESVIIKHSDEAKMDPSDGFSAFDKSKLIHLAQLYPDDFSEMELMALDDQLETYIVDMQTSKEFSNLKGISDLAQKMVETRRDKVFSLVYLLIKLAMMLPVATATVERAFSAMNIVKNRLRNRMGDQWVNDCLISYIEKDVLDEVDNEDIIDMFQKMKTRRGHC